MLQRDSECARRTLAPCSNFSPDTYRTALAPISSCLSVTCRIVCLLGPRRYLLQQRSCFLCFVFLTIARHRIPSLRSRVLAPRGNSKVAASHKPAGLCRSSFCCSLGSRFFRIATANTPLTSHTHTHTSPPDANHPPHLPCFSSLPSKELIVYVQWPGTLGSQRHISITLKVA